MIKAIIFDYDGVIGDSLEHTIERWEECSRVYGNSKKLSKEFVRESKTGSWRSFYLKELGIPQEKIELSSALFKAVADKQAPCQVFDGISDAVKTLVNEYDLYILSANYSGVIKRDLAKYDILKYFKDIAGHEEIGNISKPDPNFILKPLASWGLDPKDVIYLGDTSDEVECGNSAGLKTIGCTWGYQSKKLIEESKPSAIADDPLELSRLIKELSF